jgi:hypothetical protein
VPGLSQTINLTGHATAIVGHTQVFNYGEDLVEVSVVPQADLAACADDRFVPPGGQWEGASHKLGYFGALIVTGELGTGRRTAALRLLSGISADDPIYELVPTWKRPSTSILPLPPGTRCLLDMSEPTEKPPSDDFGKKLLNWAREKDLVMVVIAADEAGAGRWASSAENAAIRLRSPDARELAYRELSRTAAGKLRSEILDHTAFDEIWLSAPKATDTRRLVKLIAEEPFRSPEQITDEYRGWRGWIEGALRSKKLGPRTLMWAAAFCDDGQRGSVLRMSEDLRRKLKEDRGPAAVLSDAPASARLDDAGIKPNGDRVRLDPVHHGIAEALRVYLWREFEDPPLRSLLTEWLVEQLGELPPDDAARLARGVLDIVVRFRDDTLLRAVRDNLTGDKQPIAARLLSWAAVDPQFGAHVRSSLYSWAKDSRSHADLVAAVCGGEFGEQLPGLALVRLGWAAQKSGPDSPALASALTSIAARHPAAVLESIAKWIDDKDRLTAGVNAFLALASTSTGAALLCEQADPATDQAGYRDRLISWFHRSADESDTSYQATISVFRKWEKLSADGTISSRIAIPVLGRAIEPALGKNAMRQLLPGFPDMDNFWSQVFTIAVRGEEALQEADLPDSKVATPDALDAEADGPADASLAAALPPEATTPEASATGDPTPAPEAVTSPSPQADTPGTPPPPPPPPQAIPEEHDTETDAPVVSGLPADPETDTDAQPD